MRLRDPLGIEESSWSCVRDVYVELHSHLWDGLVDSLARDPTPFVQLFGTAPAKDVCTPEIYSVPSARRPERSGFPLSVREIESVEATGKEHDENSDDDDSAALAIFV